MRLFLLEPEIVFAARVNMSTISYPIRVITYDGVTTGNYSDAESGMTVLFGSSAGADDYGRSRIVDMESDGATMYIGYSSRGTRDGEVDVVDNAYITVLADRRVWSKIPVITDDGEIIKDGAVGEGTYITNTVPVANTGPGTAGDVDAGTGLLTVTFDGSSSFATAPGASISSYAWSVSGGTITSGATSSSMTATFNAGFYWVTLQVTDSNGTIHLAHCPVYARSSNPLADETISAFEIESHRITPQGQTLSVRILEDIPASTYPDGTLVILYDGEPVDATDRSHIVFIGWIDTDDAQIEATRTGTLQDTVINCLDVAGKLDKLPGFPQEVEHAASPSTWMQMNAPNMDRYLHYLLMWHSTALEVADFTWSGTTTSYPFVILGSDGESLFDQTNRRANALVPDYHLTCTRHGQLQVKVDPMLQDSGDRTATVQTTLTEALWSDIRYTHQRPPRIHWLRSNAIKASNTVVSALFCIAPGDAPGQGETAMEHGEQLAIDQDGLNSCEGHRYARHNAPQGYFSITLAQGDDLGIEPADMTWVQLTVSATTAAQRGLSLSTERGLVREMDIRYSYERTGIVKTINLVWERETEGLPAVTVIPPAVDNLPTDDWWDDDYWDDVDDPPVSPQPFAGHNKVVAINTDGYLYKTEDFQTSAASGGPTWSRVNLSLTGTLHSYTVDPFSPAYVGTGTEVNGWVVTSTDIYYIEDMFAASPTVTSQHTFGTALGSGNGLHRTIVASFGAYVSNTGPAWVMCVTSYQGTSGHTGNWATYTTDGGTTWETEVQITAHYDSQGQWDVVPGLYVSPKTAGLAYTFAYTATGTKPDTAAYKSTDYGATWGAVDTGTLNIDPGIGLGGIHIPWPDNPGENIVYHGWEQFVSGDWAHLYRVNGTTRTDISPTGSDGYDYGHRYGYFGCRTYDADRRYVSLAGTGSRGVAADRAVFISSNGGDSWTEIVAPVSSAPYPTEAAFASNDPNVLYIWGNNYLSYTQDFGATVEDKRGNMSSLGTPSLFIGFSGGTS